MNNRQCGVRPEGSKRMVVTSWRPIEEYNPAEHDWVLLKVEEIESGLECIPRVGEYHRVEKKWYFLADPEPVHDIYKITHFFDMSQLK